MNEKETSRSVELQKLGDSLGCTVQKMVEGYFRGIDNHYTFSTAQYVLDVNADKPYMVSLSEKEGMRLTPGKTYPLSELDDGEFFIYKNCMFIRLVDNMPNGLKQERSRRSVFCKLIEDGKNPYYNAKGVQEYEFVEAVNHSGEDENDVLLYVSEDFEVVPNYFFFLPTTMVQYCHVSLNVSTPIK